MTWNKNQDEQNGNAMKILYICRLYSGFEDSLKSREWSPKGAPTIAKIIEYVDTSPDYEPLFVLTCKDYGTSWDATKDQVIQVKNFKTPFHILAGQKALPSWLWKFREKFSDLRQLHALWRIAHNFKPDLIYCDRVNLLPAVFFTKFSKTPVIWRVMGVLQQMHDDFSSKSLRSSFKRFLYKSPFAAVICTLDGSGGKAWMKKMLSPQTRSYTLLNGFNQTTITTKPPTLLKTTKTRILFSGRIEHLKGLDVLIDAAEILHHNQINNIEIIVAGYGSAENWLKEEICKRNLENYFVFLGGLTPAKMQTARLKSDIFLSCGTHGNLTNTVIEALSDGLCVIIPQPNKQSNVDQDTDEFLPENVAIRYGLQNDSNALAQTLINLHNDPERRKEYARNAQSFAGKYIESWETRIQKELEIYQSVISEEGRLAKVALHSS